MCVEILRNHTVLRCDVVRNSIVLRFRWLIWHHSISFARRWNLKCNRRMTWKQKFRTKNIFRVKFCKQITIDWISITHIYGISVYDPDEWFTKTSQWTDACVLPAPLLYSPKVHSFGRWITEWSTYLHDWV